MTPFRISDELRKGVQPIYLFGLIGIFVRLYGIPASQVPVSPIRNDKFDLSAICGLAVAYLGVTYLFRYFAEYFVYEADLLNKAENTALSAQRLETFNSVVVPDPTLQGILASFRKRRSLYLRFVNVSMKAVFVADVVAPVTFLIICCVELTRPVCNFVIDLFSRL